jgi:hypothetical protein
MGLAIGMPELLSMLTAELNNLPDERKPSNNTKYTVEEALLSAFSVFFMQSRSFLDHQRLMKSQKGKDNAQSLFGIENIPCDNQIRTLLDLVPASTVFGVFRSVYDGLSKTGNLKPYQCFGGEFLLTLDGTEYFSSKKIHCPHCCHRHHKNGSTTYYHAAVTPILVAPGRPQVLGLEPEFITPQDGHDKQDCENAAAKRWIAAHPRDPEDLPVTLLGDDLYCNQPICETALAHGYHFIFVCKRTSHSELYEWVDYLERVGEVKTLTQFEIRGRKRLSYHYRFVNRIPLRATQPAMEVNWCEVTVTDPSDEKTLYYNAFATCHELDEQNVVEIVTAGRARWKVENEGNNILKTKGYHLEHNFGHGQNHLAELLFCLNLLAYLFHTSLDLVHITYRAVRSMLVTRQTFFNDVRALTRYLWFESWQTLWEFMLREGKATDGANSS